MIHMWGLMAHTWEAEAERLGNRGPPGFQNETGVRGRSEGGGRGDGNGERRMGD